MSEEPQRKIRSFVRRQGRMTSAQASALERFWERYVIAADHAIDLDAVFGRNAPRVLEIGFGMGDALAAMALAHPEMDYLGIEVHRPGVGSLLRLAEQQSLANVRVIIADAVEVLTHHMRDDSFDAVHLFFPDPWPKQRHHKRRIVQPAFVELLRHKLKNGGRLHMATDWEDYARHMLAVMRAAPGYVNAASEGEYSPRPPARPLTRFEQRGQRLGHDVWDLVFVRRE